MQTSGAVVRQPIRYVPYNGAAVLPPWLREPPRRPRICLTWGTSTTRIAGAHLFAPPVILEGLRDLDVEVVVTLTDAEADLLTEVPDGVRVVRRLALHLLLPTCTAILHQGGNGTLLTGAYYGVPQLVMPQLPDQTFHTERYVSTGAGLSLGPADVTADGIRGAVVDLLTDPRYRANAERLRAEMQATPTPAEVVPDLARLISAAYAG